MIKAVLLDLDDTLITTHIDTFFPLYLHELGQYSSQFAPAELFIEQLMASFYQTLHEYAPTRPMHPRLMARFAANNGYDLVEMEPHFQRFYAERYAVLRHRVQPRAGTPSLLSYLFDHNLPVVVATNPGLPITAIRQRMAWGGIEPDVDGFALVTSLEEMHFGKPSAEYYAEIALRLDVEPGEAIMVGDDWDNDIVGAAAAGLHTYWITEDNAPPPDHELPLTGCGSYADFIVAVCAGWLETLPTRPRNRQALTHRLAAFPAVVDVIRQPHRRQVLECCPGEAEWSARDIVCHLRDHELEDRERLTRILAESNPFLSANVNPWASGAAYHKIPFAEAFATFVSRRAETVAWLKSLSDADWKRPARDAIFGPTCFEEMVGFVSDHDRTHLHQMQEAIDYALTVCGDD